MKKIRTGQVQALIWLTLGFAASLQGQYYFGRNKIQYNRFRWQVLKTEHFEIYFYPEMESLAETGAAFAEEAYQELQNRFNHNILRRIPLVFYASHFHFEETNTLPYLVPAGVGGFFEFIKGRVVIPADGSLPRFKKTIWHELVHVFQRSYTRRILRDHRILNRYIPLWFVEGLAEYWSEGWGRDAEMVIRDGVLNNNLVPIQHLGYISGTYLMYKEGQSILQYVASEFGDEEILRIMQNIWKADRFSEVLKITLGLDAEELNEAWMYHLKKTVYPLLSQNDLPRMVTTRVTDKGYNTLPVFYRDSTAARTVFMANRDGYSSIYIKTIADDKSDKPALLIRGEKTPEVESFHLDKSRIDVDASGLLVFAGKHGARDALFIYSIPEREIIRRFQFDDIVSLYSPAWSPDGRSIAFSGLDRGGQSDLYFVDVETGGLQRLTRDDFEDRDPTWSPDGRLLVFSSDRSHLGHEGYTNLFVFDMNDGSVRYVTSGPFRDENPAFSPGGQYIVFSSDRNGVPNIWVIESGQRGETSSTIRPVISLYDTAPDVTIPARLKQATDFATGAFFPSWTDSLGLIFTAYENFGFQIRYIDDVLSTLSDREPAKAVTLVRSDTAWTFPRIRAASRTSRVRYKRRFTLDIAQSAVVQDPIYGTAGGGQVMISDMLGDEQYYFLLFNNARTSSEFWDGFNFAATRVDLSRRINYALGLYRLAGRYFNYYEGYFYESRYGGHVSVSYPLNTFERIETQINIRHSDKDRYMLSGSRRAFLVSNFISYTKDNSLWGPTGPLDGERFNITLGNTVDVQHANVSFTTVMVDLRKYFRLGFRTAHAVRVWGQFNQGKEALPFVMGGSWDLRGYRLWSLWGPKLVMISNELRFPLLDQLYLGFPFGGLGFSSIRGALFVDAGNVWDKRFGEWKGSFGFGVRLRFGGYLVLRLDVGRKTDFKSIERDTFTQFFFGWDF